MRDLFVIAVIASLSAVAWAGVAYAGNPAVQPDPPFPPAETPAAILAQYDSSQSDASSEEETRVRAAVDLYFTLILMSMAEGKALDFGFLVDQSTSSGQTLYRYEIGRLEFSLAWWEQSGWHLSYEYAPVYQSISVDGPVAVVDVVPTATFWDGAKHFTNAVQHRLTLGLTPQGWKLVSDDYEDNFKEGNPVGTDFSARMPPPGDETVQPPPGIDPDEVLATPANSLLWAAAAAGLVALNAVLALWFSRRQRPRNPGT